jgi:hypothetical protein
MPREEDVVFLDLDCFPFTLKISFTNRIQVYIILDITPWSEYYPAINNYIFMLRTRQIFFVSNQLRELNSKKLEGLIR